jgi:hypothetical protein
MLGGKDAPGADDVKKILGSGASTQRRAMQRVQGSAAQARSGSRQCRHRGAACAAAPPPPPPGSLPQLAATTQQQLPPLARARLLLQHAGCADAAGCLSAFTKNANMHAHAQHQWALRLMLRTCSAC